MTNYFTGDWEQDSAIMYDILEQIEFYSGTERKNMIYVPQKIGGSMLYGVTWKKYLSPEKDREYDADTGLYKTKIYAEHPELKFVYKEFANYHFPEFEWSQVQMNKNFPCPPHFDSKNIGESVLCCFGEYKGGCTCLYDDDSKSIMKYDPRTSPLKFNGAKILHWVDSIRGKHTRYSLVFFNNNKLTLLKNIDDLSITS